MRLFNVCLWAGVCSLLFLSGCQSDHKFPEKLALHSGASEPVGANNLAFRWTKLILEATAHDTERFKPRPTVTSRFLGLIYTAIYDAWSRYDDRAEPVYLEGVTRRPTDERTLENKEKAISYAALRAMEEYYYSDSMLFRAFMQEIGYDPADTSTDPSTAAGIGNLAAARVIRVRHGDGANQYAEEEGSDSIAYFDYTHYVPVNSADEIHDIERWAPKYFSDGHGGKYAPGCLSPQWGLVKPIALTSPDQFRSPPPPAMDSPPLISEVKEVIDLQAGLSDRERALVEFMRDGPASVQQAGHWLIFAQDVSLRDHHTLDQDVLMYFLVEVTAMDCFIACWDTKMHYDFARPYALVHHFFGDQKIVGWAGPEKGTIEMNGADWRPYSPETFLCPPFPSYVSGHSTVSGGCSEALRLYTGSDYFGQEVTLVPGSLTEANRLGPPVVLHFPSFTETANQAGISRVLGGYHIQADNLEGLKLGRTVGQYVYGWYLQKTHGEG